MTEADIDQIIKELSEELGIDLSEYQEPAPVCPCCKQILSKAAAEYIHRVLTFQKTKGANHLADRDIYIIVTHLNPDHYAELNVVGQWLGIPDVIELHYRDQISQAVGRNKGFRDTGKGRKTVVIASSKLEKSSIFRSAARPAPQPSSQERQSGWSEFRKKTHEQIASMMMTGNEFTPQSAGHHDHLCFYRTNEKLW